MDNIRLIAATALACLLAVVPCAGATDTPPSSAAAQAFVRAPGAATFMLDSLTRMDMVDYYRAGSTGPTTTLAGAQASIVSMDSMAMAVRLSPRTVAELWVLPGPSGGALAVAETITAGTVQDSSVDFYGPDWRPLDAARLLREPALADWLTPQGRAEVQEVRRALRFIPFRAAYDPSAGVLTLSHTLERMTDTAAADAPPLSRWLRPQVQYRWDGRRFRPIKQK